VHLLPRWRPLEPESTFVPVVVSIFVCPALRFICELPFSLVRGFRARAASRARVASTS
jgi:hypothetical protein